MSAPLDNWHRSCLKWTAITFAAVAIFAFGAWMGVGKKLCDAETLLHKSQVAEWQEKKHQKKFSVGPFNFERADNNPYLYIVSVPNHIQKSAADGWEIAGAESFNTSRYDNDKQGGIK